jgi:hypothetical protein
VGAALVPSQLDAIVEGIAAQLRTITDLKNVLTYYPDQAGPLPMIYLDAEGLGTPDDEWAPKGAMTIDWTIEAYLVVAPVTAKSSAVATLTRQLLGQIAEVLGHDLDAHGALASPDGLERDGIMKLTGLSRRGYARIGTADYYARQLTIQAIEMFTYAWSE